MKIPKRIQPLVDDSLVDEVISSLMSGKEAAVYLVRCGNDIRCAKVYKEANKRGFHKQALYREGRRVRNSRQARAMKRGSRYGVGMLVTMSTFFALLMPGSPQKPTLPS